MRLWLPESPRWLMTHGRAAEAERVVAGIERRVHGERPMRRRSDCRRCGCARAQHTPLPEVVHTLLHRHRQRTLVGLALMAAQAFFYNAIFFTYALVLTDFYGIPASHVGWYILPFAAGNFLGPLLLGRLFDVIGRRPMIAFTYIMSGVLLAISGYLFAQGMLERHAADIGLDRDLLLRLGGGKLGLSHRQRDLPAGNPRARHRVLLRGRHRRSAAWPGRGCSAR